MESRAGGVETRGGHAPFGRIGPVLCGRTAAGGMPRTRQPCGSVPQGWRRSADATRV